MQPIGRVVIHAIGHSAYWATQTGLWSTIAQQHQSWSFNQVTEM